MARRGVAGAALLVLLAGCTAGPGSIALVPSSTPTVTDAAPAATDGVRLDCSVVVPAAGVAGVLGVPVEDLILGDPVQQTDGFAPSTALVGIAMASAALEASGQQSCRYVVPAGDDPGPSVVVTVLPDSGTYFTLTEPDSNDGHPMAPVELGDAAYYACRGGEWHGCRAQVLVGTTWLSITVAMQEPADDAFLAYAATMVDQVRHVTLPDPLVPPRAECPTLLSPHDLTAAGRLVGASGGDVTPVGSGNFRFQVPAYRAGLVDCSWASDQSAPWDVVRLTVLPAAGDAWRSMAFGALNSPIALQAVDLAREAGAAWPKAGVQAYSGCAESDCQVTLLAGGVWLTVTTTGPADLADATALAVRAYARYADAV
ncbi:hypothetical protein E3T61_12605 [Cryobacterium lactosi]|uniref:DUF3558 domain-containing protein n=1 Tax=Cryobacterium lactosi TaxID=1259202 RepID=A0A4R9BQK6_9MICO|nr:hypothetical protein [Cryobacterium lactosi]TFD87965.1 hypothetical protein E3T61_12605 [Cryobacterium lactosi]